MKITKKILIFDLKIEKYIEIYKNIVQNRSINFDWKGGTYFVREIRQPFCECT